MHIAPEQDVASIVLLGSLNPAIFHPQWFAKRGLLEENLADSAEITIVHRQVSQFTVGNLSFLVQPDRFMAKTTSPPFVELADLMQNTFVNYLPHTPLTRLGMNREVHFGVGSSENTNAIGMMLAPQEPWGEWGRKFEAEGKNRGGMRTLIMEQRGIEGRFQGHLQVKIEPSPVVPDNAGVYISTNDDFIFESPENIQGCDNVMDLLRGRFERG